MFVAVYRCVLSVTSAQTITARFEANSTKVWLLNDQITFLYTLYRRSITLDTLNLSVDRAILHSLVLGAVGLGKLISVCRQYQKGKDLLEHEGDHHAAAGQLRLSRRCSLLEHPAGAAVSK